MIARDDLLKFINTTLNPDHVPTSLLPDLMANGAQLLGAESVNTIGFGVTCSQYSLEAAVASGCQMVVFHHGLDLRLEAATLPRSLQDRLKIAFNHNLTVAGYHFLLDSHPTLGNSAQLALVLKLKNLEACFDRWGVVGDLETNTPIEEFIALLETALQHPVHSVIVNPLIKRVAVVTGAGKPNPYQIEKLLEVGVDTLVTGEASEAMPHLCREYNLNYLVGGHYQTERFGPEALMKLVSTTYPDLKTVWLEAEFQW